MCFFGVTRCIILIFGHCFVSDQKRGRPLKLRLLQCHSLGYLGTKGIGSYLHKLNVALVLACLISFILSESENKNKKPL